MSTGAIVELNGMPLGKARAVFARIIRETNDKVPPRKIKLPKMTAKQERNRLKSIATGERGLQEKLLKALAQMRSEVLRPLGIREADDSNNPGWNLEAYYNAVDHMSADALDAALNATMYELYRVGVTHARAEIGTSFNVDPRRAKEAIDAYALDFSHHIVADEKKALKDLLKQAFDDGIHPRDLAPMIMDFFDSGVHQFISDGSQRIMPDDAWALTVARTETARAQNNGIADLFAEAGIAKVTWLAADDARTEPLCADLDGEQVDFGEVFPGTDVTQPPLHPNCRCTIVAAEIPLEAVAEADHVLDSYYLDGQRAALFDDQGIQRVTEALGREEPQKSSLPEEFADIIVGGAHVVDPGLKLLMESFYGHTGRPGLRGGSQSRDGGSSAIKTGPEDGTAVFMMGGGGSGKGRVLEALTAGGLADGSRHFDSDAEKRQIALYSPKIGADGSGGPSGPLTAEGLAQYSPEQIAATEQYVKDNTGYGSIADFAKGTIPGSDGTTFGDGLTHELSSYVAKDKMLSAIAAGPSKGSFVYDSTGSLNYIGTPGQHNGWIDQATAAGFNVRVIHVDSDPRVAQYYNSERTRSVDPALLEGTHAKVTEIAPQVYQGVLARAAAGQNVEYNYVWPTQDERHLMAAEGWTRYGKNNGPEYASVTAAKAAGADVKTYENGDQVAYTSTPGGGHSSSMSFIGSQHSTSNADYHAYRAAVASSRTVAHITNIDGVPLRSVRTRGGRR